MTTDGPSDADSPTEDLGNVPGRGSWGHESDRPTSLYPTVGMRRPMPEAPQQRRIPARLIIVAWVTLLMATVLALVNRDTWSALTAKADERVDRTLSQEIGEFQEFAEVGVDPITGKQLTDVAELFRVHLEHRCIVVRCSGPHRDGKSTRLNSSHVSMSYAVF